MEVALTDLLYALFITPRNLIIVAMAWALVVMIGKVIPDRWNKTYRDHWSPAILLVVCSASVWISGLRPGVAVEGTGIEGHEIGWRIGLGIILALASYLVPVVAMWALKKYLPSNVVKQIRKLLL